LDLPSR